MENLLHRKIKGFKFEYYRKQGYNSKMNKHIGKIGKITELDKDDVKVQFEDGNRWYYPIYLIQEHLIQG